MGFERLTPIYTTGKGLPIEGQVFSLVNTRQTVWAQRRKSEFIQNHTYTLVGILPEDLTDKCAMIRDQEYVAFETGAAERHKEDITQALLPEFRNDVRYV